jgi:hypothetical protein
MPDNWEHALRYAQGKYITYLTDDSYLVPNAVSVAMAELQRFKAKVAVWKHCAYYASDWVEPARRNVLYIPRLGLGSHLVSSRISLEKLYRDLREPLIPKCLNSIVHRSVIQSVLGVQARFFLPSCPDYSSAASILLNVPTYLVINRPLFIDGVTTCSIGAAGRFEGGSSQEFWSEFGQNQTTIAFLGIRTNVAAIGASLESVREHYLTLCPSVNRDRLVRAILDDLMRLEVNGVSIQSYREVLKEYLSAEPNCPKIAETGRRLLSILKWKIMKRIRSSPRMVSLERLRGFDILSGQKYGFRNIEESCRIVMARVYAEDRRKLRPAA